MQHLAGWFQDVDQAAAAADIAAMPDEAVTVNGNFVRCPDALPNLLGAAVVTIATTFTRARVESPTLRTLANFDILPANRIATPEADPAIAWLGPNPQPLTAGEDVSFNTNTDHAAAIEIYGAVWFGDGPVQPVNGAIFTVRCTAGITQLQGVWTNGALTFSRIYPLERMTLLVCEFKLPVCYSVAWCSSDYLSVLVSSVQSPPQQWTFPALATVGAVYWARLTSATRQRLTWWASLERRKKSILI